MAEVRQSVDVAASPDRAWALLTDWDRQREWMIATRVRPVAGDGRGVGEGLHAFTGLGPVGFLDPMRIVVWEPPQRCEVVHTGRLVRGTASFAVHPGGEGRARVTWTEELDLPGGPVARLLWPLARPVAALGLRVSLRRFAALLGSPAGQAR